MTSRKKQSAKRKGTSANHSAVMAMRVQQVKADAMEMRVLLNLAKAKRVMEMHRVSDGLWVLRVTRIFVAHLVTAGKVRHKVHHHHGIWSNCASRTLKCLRSWKKTKLWNAKRMS